MDAYVARQPIFDANRDVFGYELLFRSGPENLFCGTDGDKATANVLSHTLHFQGLDALTAGKKCFVNITRRILLDELYTMLPPDRVVLELLEDIEPDADVLAACKKIRRAGYTLALDDYILEDRSQDFLPLINLLKVDFMGMESSKREEAAKRAAAHGHTLLAEKVETHEDFKEAAGLGYGLFQGFFFCKPEMMKQRNLPVATMTQLRLLEHLNQPTIKLDELDSLIRQDIGLSYKLLRFLNSAAFSFRTEITSIKRALVLLGDRPLRRWASLIILSGMSNDKPQELMSTYLIRAKLCEKLAELAQMSDQSNDAFLLGMFSLLDAILDQPMSALLEQLALCDEIKAALLGDDGPLRTVLDLAIAVERGQWDRSAAATASLMLSDEEVARAYQEAVGWSAELTRQCQRTMTKSEAA